MTGKERLLATFEGKQVDRPAVSFYEIGGWRMEEDGDEFHVWNDPSWRPLVDMALGHTDIIRFVSPVWTGENDNGLGELTQKEMHREGRSLFTRVKIRTPGGILSSLTRRDMDIQTTWVLEPLLKNPRDAECYLMLPERSPGILDVTPLLEEEKTLADSGIVSVEMADPICTAASLFSMEEYTVIALTEPVLFHRLLERFERLLLPRCMQVAEKFPGHLWRICGSEYASEPYLPPRLYEEYVVRYTGKMVKAIQEYGGYARIHSHGRLRGIMPFLKKMKPDGLDPCEPPPQGDMSLSEIKASIGKETVLMGNIEVADIENLPTEAFKKKVMTALREGAAEGRGFILHPSSCPYGRKITPRTMANYKAMVLLAEAFV